MLSKTNRLFARFINYPSKYYKMKLNLSEKNITIAKQPNYLKVNIFGTGEGNITTKSFLFGNII